MICRFTVLYTTTLLLTGIFSAHTAEIKVPLERETHT